jgi:hypothetical protein
MDAVNNILMDDGSEEYKYVLGLCGTLTNIAAHQKGRLAILNLPNGLKYVHNAVHCISNLAMPQGRILMRSVTSEMDCGSVIVTVSLQIDFVVPLQYYHQQKRIVFPAFVPFGHQKHLQVPVVRAE